MAAAYLGMTTQRRSILPPSAIVTPTGDLGAEGCNSPNPTTTGALGSESAHGDVKAYHEAAAASEGIHDGGSPGLALPTDVDKFITREY